MIKEMKFMTAANHYTPAESERRGAAGGRLPMKRFFGRMTAELKENKAVLLVWGGILHDAYRIVCHRSAGRRNGPAGSLCSCSDKKYIH